MINRIIEFSLRNRWLVLAAYAALSAALPQFAEARFLGVI